MALSYEQSATLMQDATFRNRVKIACLKYADYIIGEAANTPGHSTRVKWAQQTMLSPESAVNNITPTCVMDAAVQEQGGAIDDPGLQSATENAINKLL
jgi:hypothetical protein